MDGATPLCEQKGFDKTKRDDEVSDAGVPGCYLADPSDIHELFALHQLLNSAASKDMGLAEVILKTWAKEGGEDVDVELIADIAFIHGLYTHNRGPQHIVGAIQYQRAAGPEPENDGMEEP